MLKEAGGRGQAVRAGRSTGGATRSAAAPGLPWTSTARPRGRGRGPGRRGSPPHRQGLAGGPPGGRGSAGGRGTGSGAERAGALLPVTRREGAPARPEDDGTGAGPAFGHGQERGAGAVREGDPQRHQEATASARDPCARAPGPGRPGAEEPSNPARNPGVAASGGRPGWSRSPVPASQPPAGSAGTVRWPAWVPAGVGKDPYQRATAREDRSATRRRGGTGPEACRATLAGGRPAGPCSPPVAGAGTHQPQAVAVNDPYGSGRGLGSTLLSLSRRCGEGFRTLGPTRRLFPLSHGEYHTHPLSPHAAILPCSRCVPTKCLH